MKCFSAVQVKFAACTCTPPLRGRVQDASLPRHDASKMQVQDASASSPSPFSKSGRSYGGGSVISTKPRKPRASIYVFGRNFAQVSHFSHRPRDLSTVKAGESSGKEKAIAHYAA